MNLPSRTTLIHASLALFAVAIVGRAAQVQLFQRQTWQAKATKQHYKNQSMPAVRGMIVDVSGVPLAATRQQVQLGVSPKEVTNRAWLARSLKRLRMSREQIARATDTTLRWVSFNERFLPSQ